MTRTRSMCLLVLTAMAASTVALVVGPVSDAGADNPPPAGFAAGTGNFEGTESFQNEESYLPQGIACFKAIRSVYSVRGTGTYEGVTAVGQPVVYKATIATGEYLYSDGPIHVDVENTEVYYHGIGGTYGDHVACSGAKAEVPAEFRIWATDHVYRLDGAGSQVPCVGHGTFMRGGDPQWQAQWTLDADCTVVGNGAGTPGTGIARAGTGFTDAGNHAPCFDACPNNIVFDYTQYLPYVGQHVGVTGISSAKVNTQAAVVANLTDDGIAVAGAPITFSVAGPAATTPGGATVSTAADGRASFSFTSTTAGAYIVTASTPSEIPGETVSGTLPVQFTPPPPPTVVLSGPTTGQTDEATPVLATFTDDDVAVAGGAISFSVTGPGTATPATATVNTNAQGTALFNLSGNRAGDYTVTASATRNGHDTSDTHTVALAIKTFYREAALTLPSTEKPLKGALVDPAGDYAYFGSVGGVTKIDLHTFQRVGVLTLPSGESASGPAAIDPAGVYAYFANPTNTGGSTPDHPAITKIDLRTFQRVGVLNLPQDQINLSFAAIDPAGHYLYTGSHNSSGYPVEGTIIKVNLDTFEWADIMALGPDDQWVSVAVISPAGDFGYFGTIGGGSGPAHVVKVNLATFTRVGSLGMDSSEHSIEAGVIDPAGRFAYFSTSTPPASPETNHVVKVDLTGLQRMGVMALPTSEFNLYSAVMDPAGKYAYFATSLGTANSTTAKDTIIKIDLKSFQRAHAIQLNVGENIVKSAVISPDGSHAYFGSNRGKVVKVALTRPPNPALVAANDTYATDFVTPLSVSAPGVLANDVDTGDGDPLSAGQASDPPGGSVVLNANGSFTYTPDGGFSGTDTFTYTANDAKDYSAPATVSVSVAAPPTGVSSVGGGACGFYTHVGLFGGPPERRGCGQTADIPAGTSPSVTLPPAGSPTPITATKPEGAMGLYGPAAIFSGQWPADASAPSNSGPLSVSTQGSTGTGGSATSAADVVLFDTPLPVRCYGDPPGTTNCSGPGGIGPGPIIADEAHSACAADESGLSASASFVNGVFETKYDVVTQLPIVSEPIPSDPPPNYTRSGTLDHVGDSYRVVFNEQILGSDSITVNAAHMYLLGPTAVGDMVVAQSRCAITTGVANAAPVANDDAYTVVPGDDLVVPAAGVLTNDTDADAQALSASKVLPTPPPASGGGHWTFGSDPAHGSLELGTDGSFTYTPDDGFEGSDTFVYLVTDPRGRSDQATVTVTVAPPLGISASPASVNPGAPVTATWTGITAPSATDWVGLYDSSSAPDPALLSWAYTGGAADGTLALTVPPGAAPGATYELRLFANNSYDRLATSAPFAVVASVATLAASPSSVSAGGPVTATWGAIAAPTATDWVGLYDSSSAADSSLLAWAYTDGSGAGSVSLTVPPSASLGATYELRLFSNNSYTRLATSVPFAVAPPPPPAAMVADINPGSANAAPGSVTDVNGTKFFAADDGIHGSELWKSDGTAAGTMLVKDINPGTATSSPGLIMNLNGTAVFSANDGVSGTELWKSDGTAAGTVQLADINPAGSSSPTDMTAVGGILFFIANDGTHGVELWKTDGTTAGTALVKDIFAGSSGSRPGARYYFNFNGTLLFPANDGTTGTELWRSDGTDAGTVQVADINPGSPSSSFFWPVLLDGVVYFRGEDATHGRELWKTDGTAAGTAVVYDFLPAYPGSALEPEYLTVFNGALYFTAFDGNGNDGDGQNADGRELWKSDGTATGTTLLKDIYPGSSNGFPSEPGFVVANGILFFSATDGTTAGGGGQELWKTDGSTAGTVRVKNINPGGGSSIIPNTLQAVSANSTLYFAASDSTVGSGKGMEVWQSDGTAAGTVRTADINPGTASASPTFFTNVGGTVYFRANDGTHGTELWRLGGPAVAPPTVTAGPGTVAAGSPVTATWSNIVTPGPTDWVGLYPTGSTADSGLVTWAYTNGAAGGSLSLNVPPGSPPGTTYELRLFSANSYTRLATSAPITVVASTATISASPQTANPGAPLTATWGGIGAPNATDWVGLYDSDSAPNPALLAWAYTGGTAAGSVNLVVPAGAPLGSNYELRLFTNNSYTRLATSSPFSVATSSATVSASPSSVANGAPVTATWSGIAVPTASDWVGIYPSSGAGDPTVITWAYTGGAAAGSLNLTVPLGSTPGATYELRLFSNNSYTRLATSAPFSVT